MSTLLQVALVLILVPQTAPQQQRYSVEGNVILDGGFTNRPIAVFLEPLSSRRVEEASANVAGNFRFEDVPAGSYYIRVKQAGFEEAAQRIDVPAFNRGVVIYLQRKANAAAPQSEIVLGDKFEVDIRQLSIPKDAVREYRNALDDKRKGKAPRAIEGLRRALRIAPDFIEAAFHLGSTLYDAGHFEDAEKVLIGGLKAVPGAAKLRLMLANVFVKERKYDQALLQIDSYLEENPNDSDRASAETTREQLIRAMNKRAASP